MFNSADIQQILKEYMATSDGKSVVCDAMKGKFYTKADAQKIASELRSSLIDAFKSAMKNKTKAFDASGIRVEMVKDSKSGWKVNISFDARSLHRDSLLCIDKTTHTGSGVYDIFGLFTNGYTAKRTVFGFWQSPNATTMGLAASMQTRKPNDFIKRTIQDFLARYPGLEIKYPALWGGDQK